MYKIYSLNDPNTNKIRYIGYTSRDVDIRLKEHIRNSKYTESHKAKWIRSIDYKPTINILKDNISSMDEVMEQEKLFIKKYKNLTNGTLGGESSKEFTDEVRQKISKTLKRRYKNGEIESWNKGKHPNNPTKGKNRPSIMGDKNPFYGRTHSEKTRKILSEKNRKHKLYTYDELYDLYITKNLLQKEIADIFGVLSGYVSRLMKKYDLVKIKKQKYGKIKGKR